MYIANNKQWRIHMASYIKMAAIRILQVAIVGSLAITCLGACTFPSYIRGTWISSEKNDLLFEDSSFSGYQVATFATDNFTCIVTSGTQYVVQSEIFKRFGLNFYAFICIDLQEVTDVQTGDLYMYYKASPEQPDANNERVVFRLATFPTPTMSDVCTVSDYSSLRYSMLMKQGTIDNVKKKCPIPFLGNFRYTYDTGSGNLCNDTLVTVCEQQKDTINWDYTKCAQIQAYSADGVTNCVYASRVSNVYTVHVYNADATTDQSNTYRFTCYQARGYERVYATQYPGDCMSTMNETYVESPGATLVLNANVVCAFDITTTVLSGGVIAALVILCMLIVSAIIAALMYYFYLKRKKQKQAEWEAANRKIDPDELSPSMRLGLPQETRYDLDRLMYSPDNMKHGLIKKSTRKEIVGLDGREGYNEGKKYMDEKQRQTALDDHKFTERRKRRDNKDEFKTGDITSKVFTDRIKDLARGRKRPHRTVALAKLKFRPRPRPIAGTQDGPEGGQATQVKDIVIQVEAADTQAEIKRKTRFADEETATKPIKKTIPSIGEANKAKTLEDVETLSDIVDNENAVDDLSDDDTKEPRLILPKLKEDKNVRKPPKDRFSLGSSPQTPGMPHNTRFKQPKSRQKHEEKEFTEPLAISKNNAIYASMPPLARIHRKDNPRAWKEAFGDTNGMESMDIESMKKRMSEDRWRRLLEELYRDKKYFDYVKKSTSNSENDLLNSADASLQFLYGRALFWELQEPIPARPSSNLKRLFSKYDPPKSNTIQRSSTTLSRSGHTRVPRTPSTQVSRLKKREHVDKKKKEALNKLEANKSPVHEYLEDGTQTDFSPMPMTPVIISDMNDIGSMERLSLPGSVADDRIDTPIITFSKEVTKSDIKLEEYNNDMFDEHDPNYLSQRVHQEEGVTAAI